MIHRELQAVEILLVEDSPTDALLAREALQLSRITNHLHIAKDGVEAMAFLRAEEPFRQAPRPGLILLDLNLPKKDGREVLFEIKNDEKLKRIPVVVLTTSRSQADIFRAYGLHANCYIVKPVDFEKFADVMRSLENFWFSAVTLPGTD